MAKPPLDQNFSRYKNSWVQGWLRLTFALMKKGGRDLAIIVSMIGLNVMCQ